MKKLSLSILLLCFFAFSKAQWVTIPDTAFVSFLKAQGLTPAFNGNQMDTTHILVISQKTLVAHVHKGIKSLDGIQYFDSLVELRFTQDSIDYLPSFPHLPGTIELSRTKLTDLPPLPANLIDLKCVANPYLQFPIQLPQSLKTFDWDVNASKDTIPPFPSSLTYISIYGIGATTILAPLPPNLITLDCENNALTELPSLPGSLRTLGCMNNHLTSLPSLDSVIKLNCAYNQITSLPPLCDNMYSLCVVSNLLTSLPSLPSKLDYLNIQGNPVLSLPAFPPSLNQIVCSSTLIQSLPELPDSILYLDITNTPNLHCLPQLKQIYTFIWDSSAIHCLPNYGDISDATPPITNMPLCDIFNTNGCDVYYNITGELYKDDNGDCVKSTSEANIQNLKVDLYQGGNLQQQGYFDNFYFFNTNYGTFQTKVDTTGLPFIISCPANNTQTSIITALDSMDYNMDFALQCKPGFDLSAWSIASTNLFRPASTPLVHIKAGDFASFWGQICNTANLSGQLQITISGPASYNAPAVGALTPSSVNGNSITYTIADWSAINPETAFNILLKIDTAAQAGQSVCLNVSLTPTVGDNNPANNTLSYCFTVVASLDPNNKTVYPTGSVIGSDWLTYTVNFQNTGNSYAQHIYILDTLDSNLDESTFQLLSWSHENQTIVNGNVVRFNFPNINLPDSNANEPASHGYVQYKIKAKENLAPGAHIYNTAYIYFDFNAPVVTNTTDNRGCVPDTSGFSQTICNGDTFNFNGQLLTTEGSYLDTLQNQFGCDSIVTLNLQFYPAVTPTPWAVTICQGDTFFLGTAHYTASGNYSYAFQSMYGCDSVVNLSLTVEALPQVSLYSSCSPTGWLDNANDCGSCAYIYASTVQADSLIWQIQKLSGGWDTTFTGVDSFEVFTYVFDGCFNAPLKIHLQEYQTYIVSTQAINNCGVHTVRDTIYLWWESISETPLNNFQLYPNPAKDYVTISAEQNAVGGLLQLRDITGRVISTQVLNNKQFILNTSTLAAGVYVVTLQQKDGAIGLKRLVIE